ncbi:transcription termination/antitermination protein NusG [Methylobacterium nodulans]|uniref:NusG antitermination factor n=1 Tax=Methylobacterium nodulans (strain LMG 21967 / CNCM I-2342 / ORS 2060) TaxID=460265 RepID=B8ITP9_METNO|nr:transcription termination/antitermination NusG family protein [Methylobacterium nodulans]ACL58965.1 NusG antitermination factor [Methylobacterium nodulans ORS 2060]
MGTAPAYDPSLTYYAASVAGHGEYRACEWLQQAGFVTLVPSRTAVVRQASSGKRLVRRPVFPGYAFVGKRPEQSWRDILRVPGVRALVTTGEAPTELPPWMMKMLIAADEMAAYDRPRPQLAVGDKVRIRDELWQGLIGEVMRAPEGRRIAVLLKAFGKKHVLSVDVDRLAAT